MRGFFGSFLALRMIYSLHFVEIFRKGFRVKKSVENSTRGARPPPLPVWKNKKKNLNSKYSKKKTVNTLNAYSLLGAGNKF